MAFVVVSSGGQSSQMMTLQFQYVTPQFAGATDICTHRVYRTLHDH